VERPLNKRHVQENGRRRIFIIRRGHFSSATQEAWGSPPSQQIIGEKSGLERDPPVDPHVGALSLLLCNTGGIGEIHLIPDTDFRRNVTPLMGTMGRTR